MFQPGPTLATTLIPKMVLKDSAEQGTIALTISTKLSFEHQPT